MIKHYYRWTGLALIVGSPFAALAGIAAPGGVGSTAAGVMMTLVIAPVFFVFGLFFVVFGDRFQNPPR